MLAEDCDGGGQGARRCDLQALLQAHSERWAEVWRASGDGKLSRLNPAGIPFGWAEPLSREAIVEAARSFPTRTTLTGGWHPRFLVDADAGTLDFVSAFLWACRLGAVFPAATQAVRSFSACGGKREGATRGSGC